MKKMCYLIFFAVIATGVLGAEVRQAPCPFSCKSNGYRKKVCRDWKEGNTCYIDVKKGKTRSKQCPFSCKSAGIPKKKCRDWKEGNTCYVEDLR